MARTTGARKMSSARMRPGGGGRFDALVQKLVAQGKSPAEAKAIAAKAGRKKYGKSRFQGMAAAGRKH